MGRLELFRTQTARWFAENTPRDWQLRTNAMTTAEWLEFQRSWLTTLNTVGFGAPQVPREWGGGGYSVAEQAVIYETGCQFDAPQLRAYTISLQHVPAASGHAAAAGTVCPRRHRRHRLVPGLLRAGGWLGSRRSAYPRRESARRVPGIGAQDLVE
jgi:alkylation response protein AidB-like acyl-CoA dehydrogenase